MFRGNKFSRISISDFISGNNFSRISCVVLGSYKNGGHLVISLFTALSIFVNQRVLKR